METNSHISFHSNLRNVTTFGIRIEIKGKQSVWLTVSADQWEDMAKNFDLQSLGDGVWKPVA